MGIINKIWKRITHTNAIDQSSGELEIAFFGDVYRVAYAAGEYWESDFYKFIVQDKILTIRNKL